MKRGTLVFEKAIYVIGRGNCVGKTEGEGPLGNAFDRVERDEYCGEESFEKAETKLQKIALDNALSKAGVPMADLGVLAAGDLLNQCVASAYNVRESGVPFIGLYGACSTMALSTAVSAIALSVGLAEYGGAVTSSHFCSAERQFRYPLEYGGGRPPSAQRTVTGAGALILTTVRSGAIRVRAVQIGQVTDYGVTDINNMGGAMAPAAMTTLRDYFKNTRTHPKDYDLIATGDLGTVGSEMLSDLMKQEGYDLTGRHLDCGKLIFDKAQDAHAGGSGCGCSASVLTAHLLPKLERGEIRRLLFVATGALMSPLTVQQKESIPGVAHLVFFEREEEN
ncbi:MAG: stage V sporulation protein AD [Clostridia bacterium]|nr:stage V sporulation protein AD [Clostridia bacterium]